MKIKHATARAIIVVVGCFYYTSSFCMAREVVLKQLDNDARQNGLELGSLSNELLKKYYEFFYDIREPKTTFSELKWSLEGAMMNKGLLVPYIVNNIVSLLEKTPEGWEEKARILVERLFKRAFWIYRYGNEMESEELMKLGNVCSAVVNARVLDAKELKEITTALEQAAKTVSEQANKS